MDTIEEKLNWLSESKIETIDFETVTPDKNHNWINQSENNWDELLPIIDKETKSGKTEEAIFRLFSRGVGTYKDEWMYDFTKEGLENKVKFFVDTYQKALKNPSYNEKHSIKWDADLESYLQRGIEKEYEKEKVIKSLYRPFNQQFFYFDKHFNGRTYQWVDIYEEKRENRYLIIPGLASPKEFFTLSSNTIIDLNCLPAGGQCLPLYRFSPTDERTDNITDWGLQQFTTHYKDKKITKEDIFHYTYAVLHHPAYRKKYELNLKREFPRIPLYDNFPQWANWGRHLMDLHIGYEKVEPYPLEQLETTYEITNPEAHAKIAKAKLKADKLKGTIELDGFTTLTGVPKEAWDYKLGNRSALEWILDQYKEKKPSDPTIAEKFNTYKFADYKEQVIDLLKRVCTVSVETMKMVNAMPE